MATPNVKLEAARLKKHWSVAEASERAGISVNTFNRWECGLQKPHMSTLAQLCKAFGMSAEELEFEDVVTPKRGANVVQELSEVTAGTKQKAILQPLADVNFIGDNEEFASVLDMMEHMMNKQDKAGGISRRQALTVLLGVSGTALCVPAASSFLPAAGEIVAFCAANIATCSQLGKGSRQDMLTAHALIGSYLPTLASLAQQLSPYQKSAADQAAIGYRLQAILSYHIENLAIADEYARLAVFYSRIAEDPNILVSSLVQRAMIASYAHRREEALTFCQEATSYLPQVTSRVRSYLYRVQAACLAQLGQDKQALASLDLAYEHFYHPSPYEVSSLHVANDEFELFLWDGITRSHINDQRDVAISLLKKVDPLKTTALPDRV